MERYNIDKVIRFKELELVAIGIEEVPVEVESFWSCAQNVGFGKKDLLNIINGIKINGFKDVKSKVVDIFNSCENWVIIQNGNYSYADIAKFNINGIKDDENDDRIEIPFDDFCLFRRIINYEFSTYENDIGLMILANQNSIINHEDGVFEITWSEYADFFKLHNVDVKIKDDFKVYAVKSNGYFMFASTNKNGEYLLLNHNMKKKLTHDNLSYYYENMVQYAKEAEKVFEYIINFMDAIYSTIKKLVHQRGLKGLRIHLDRDYPFIEYNPYEFSVSIILSNCNKRTYYKVKDFIYDKFTMARTSLHKFEYDIKEIPTETNIKEFLKLYPAEEYSKSVSRIVSSFMELHRNKIVTMWDPRLMGEDEEFKSHKASNNNDKINGSKRNNYSEDSFFIDDYEIKMRKDKIVALKSNGNLDYCYIKGKCCNKTHVDHQNISEGESIESFINRVRDRLAADAILKFSRRHKLREIEQGINVEKLSKDTDDFIRLSVLEKGFNVESFLNDDNAFIRKVAKRKIVEKLS